MLGCSAFITSNFQENTTWLKILGFLLLAEPHFAITIPILYGYKSFFITNKKTFILIPFLLVISALFLYIQNKNLFSILFLFFNIYHVNRQSLGFFKIQTGINKNYSDLLYELSLHFFTFIFFFLHFSNIPQKKLFALIVLIFIFISLNLSFGGWIFGKKESGLKKSLSAIQGFLIFSPVAFCEDLMVAFVIGIFIHYVQYLAISWQLCIKVFKYNTNKLILFLIIYSILSTSILGGKITQDKSSIVLLIPAIFQLLHFYYDRYLWRGSEIIIRNNFKKLSL